MQNNHSGGRHRKPSSTHLIARRTAVFAGTAVAAFGFAAAPATAAPAAPPPFPCTGSPLDGFTTCGASGGYGNGVTGGNAGDFAGGDTPPPGGGLVR